MHKTKVWDSYTWIEYGIIMFEKGNPWMSGGVFYTKMHEDYSCHGMICFGCKFL